MSGVRNVYNQIIVFMGFIGICGCFALHAYLSQRNQEVPDDPLRYSSVGPFIMVIIVSSINFTPFMNPKLRFDQFRI